MVFNIFYLYFRFPWIYSAAQVGEGPRASAADARCADAAVDAALLGAGESCAAADLC